MSNLQSLEQRMDRIDYQVISDDKDKRIADLEVKLAESEKSEETYKTMFEIGVENNHSLLKEIEQLKQQLAEKDVEIKNLTLAHFESKTNQLILTTTQMINQDKISFAVEQLEKVKELLYPELRFDYSLYLRVMHELDNQIKQLKEME